MPLYKSIYLLINVRKEWGKTIVLTIIEFLSGTLSGTRFMKYNIAWFANSFIHCCEYCNVNLNQKYQDHNS